MRRLVLEISQDEISKFSPSAELLERIESLEIIYHLRFDKDGFAGICRINVKDPRLDLRKLVGVGGLVRLELLSEEKGEHIVYMETRTRNMAWFRGPNVPDVFLCPPIEFKKGKLRLNFVGNLNEIKRLLARAEEVGQKFKILSLTDARFSPDSILQSLTEKQRRILSFAYKNGYYEVPRKVDSEELAQKLKIGKSTLGEHLRKAEKRLITDIMGKEEEAFPLSLIKE
jgi:HTH DNA binding domain